MTIEVELDMMSGVPNPRWRLSRAEEGVLREHLRALGASGAADAWVPPLGYRGLRLRAGGAHPFDTAAVHGGIVRLREGCAERRRGDPGRALERWLLETGKDRISPAHLREALAALE